MSRENSKHPYLDGDAYFDIPDQEYSCSEFPKSEEINFTGDGTLYPCYVYDKNGKLLRVEHPKGSGSKNLKWVWKFGKKQTK